MPEDGFELKKWNEISEKKKYIIKDCPKHIEIRAKTKEGMVSSYIDIMHFQCKYKSKVRWNTILLTFLQV